MNIKFKLSVVATGIITINFLLTVADWAGKEISRHSDSHWTGLIWQR